MKCDQIHKRILNALLDKLERSKLSIISPNPPRRIMLGFYAGGKSDFPYYDIEQSDRRILVNRAVGDLEKRGLVSFSWMKGEHGHIIEKVWLNIDNKALAYELTSRQPMSDLLATVCDEIKSVKSKVSSQWACSYLQDAFDEISKKQKLTSIIPADKEERGFLLKAISAIDCLDGNEYMERVFSLSTYGDSKVFERTVKKRLIRILRKYLDSDDDTIDEDVLKQVGIVKYPEQFEFCGNLSIEIGQDKATITDFSVLPSGVIIYSTDFTNGRVLIDHSVKQVISIENRANYVDYVLSEKTDSQLVIYHGGQFSPRKREFLRAVAKAMPAGCTWRHWGDIDYGGFLMLLRLRRHIHPGVMAHRMDESEIIRFFDFTAPIKTSYARRLKNLKSRTELSDVYRCIDYMINKQVRLEQEAMLTDTHFIADISDPAGNIVTDYITIDDIMSKIVEHDEPINAS